jgi:hypothetical protein
MEFCREEQFDVSQRQAYHLSEPFLAGPAPFFWSSSGSFFLKDPGADFFAGGGAGVLGGTAVLLDSAGSCFVVLPPVDTLFNTAAAAADLLGTLVVVCLDIDGGFVDGLVDSLAAFRAAACLAAAAAWVEGGPSAVVVEMEDLRDTEDPETEDDGEKGGGLLRQAARAPLRA